MYSALSCWNLNSFYPNYRGLDSGSSLSVSRRISIAPQYNGTWRNFSQRLRKCRRVERADLISRRRRRQRLPTGRDASRRHTPGVSSRKVFIVPPNAFAANWWKWWLKFGAWVSFLRLRTHYTRAHINIFIAHTRTPTYIRVLLAKYIIRVEWTVNAVIWLHFARYTKHHPALQRARNDASCICDRAAR